MLRNKEVDLEIGILGDSGPEIMMQTLFEDGFLGVVRAGHPLSYEPVTPERYVAYVHASFGRTPWSRPDIRPFPLPVATAPITISQMWHSRMTDAPAHRLLRQLVQSVCRTGHSLQFHEDAGRSGDASEGG